MGKVMDLICLPKLNVESPLKPSGKLILMQKIVCQKLVHGQLVQKDVSIILRINVFTGIHMPREGKITMLCKFVQIQHNEYFDDDKARIMILDISRLATTHTI